MSSLTPETVVLNNKVYQVVARFYDDPEMAAIPCFPQNVNDLPVRTQLDPKTIVEFVAFDGEFYVVQPMLELELEFDKNKIAITRYKRYENFGGTVLVHKNFLKFFLLFKPGRWR